MHTQQYFPKHRSQYAYKNQYRPSNYPPASSPVISQQYSKKLILVDKFYKTKDKFDGTWDRFAFKLSIFHDKCQLVGLLSEAYLESASMMLTD